MLKLVIFAVVALVGGYLLVLLWRRKDVQGEPVGTGVEGLMRREAPLAGDEAREWLDSFLVRHQQK